MNQPAPARRPFSGPPPVPGRSGPRRPTVPGSHLPGDGRHGAARTVAYGGPSSAPTVAYGGPPAGPTVAYGGPPAAPTVAFGGPPARPGLPPGPAGGAHRRPVPAPDPTGHARPSSAPVPPAGLPLAAQPDRVVRKPKRRRAGAWIAAIVLVGGLGAGGWFLLGEPAPVSATVGDCVTQTGEDTLSAVACGATSAEFTVAGKLENRTQVDAGTSACAAFPTATTSYWEGKEGEPGLVLCLAPIKR